MGVLHFYLVSWELYTGDNLIRKVTRWFFTAFLQVIILLEGGGEERGGGEREEEDGAEQTVKRNKTE